MKPRHCSRRPATHLALLLALCAASTLAQTEDAADVLPNGRWLDGGRLLVGGQPSPTQLEALASTGIHTLINLRGNAEPDSTRREDAEAAGLAYVSLPISSAIDLSEGNARALAIELSRADGPVAVHCASGNRVGALLALIAYYLENASPEDALEHGLEGGLTRLEPVVRERLGLPPLEPSVEPLPVSPAVAPTPSVP